MELVAIEQDQDNDGTQVTIIHTSISGMSSLKISRTIWSYGIFNTPLTTNRLSP